jgi:elongation factor Ts
MAEITAALVKELREKTGAGMMDCKKALTENSGDVESAVDWLRSKGIAAAAKRAGRVAAEGLIAVALADGAGAMVEVNSETDFVARNEVFQDLVRVVADIALHEGGDAETIKAAAYPDTDRSVDEQITQSAATIGENIRLRRAVALSVDPGLVTSYVHNVAAPGLGKIGVLVALKSSAARAQLEALGKQLAMHIAASNPAAVSTENLDPALIERERSVLTEQARESGRPDDIIAKMIEGRLRKYYQEVVLLEQTYAIDGESKVADVVAAAGKEAGADIEVAAFARFALGEGLDQS